MGGKAVIAAGLLAGLVVGGVVVGGVIVLAPGPSSPSEAPAMASASPGVSPVTAPSASASPSGNPSAGAGSPSPSATTVAQAFGIGEPAPPLTLPQLGGGEISLAALQGKPVWVNFMATWCPPCRDEIPLMNGFAARYADTDLVVVAVDVREDEALVDAFARELGIRFPVGLDRDGAAQSDWGALALPVHFWIDADGIVRDGALGGIGPDIMARGLESILPGVEVTP
ncbi:MAG TPA: redoxin domain-containing protein [Candidatus Limnocylindrales bacterium]|nr:redoxin domain-containing protein [Candidatus Limnocylindrales bacterium]